MTDLRPGPQHAQREVHRLPHVDARRGVHRVQRLLSVGRGAGVGTSPAGAKPPTSILGAGGRQLRSRSRGSGSPASRRRTGATATTSWSRRSGPAAAGSRAAAATAWTWISSRAWPGSISRAPRPSTSTTARDQPAAARPGTGSTRPRPASTRRRRRSATTARKVLFTMTDKVKSGRLGTSGEHAPLHGSVLEDRAAGGDAGPRRRVGGRASVQYYGALSGDDKYDRLQRAGRDHRRTTSTRRWIRWTSMRA